MMPETRCNEIPPVIDADSEEIGRKIMSARGHAKRADQGLKSDPY